MLKTLDIENIAVIEKTSVEFSGGLNVLTGETGAGKSIVVDSINAILGERTSKELVRHGAQNGFVSAYFDTVGSSACKKLEDLGFDMDDDGGILLSRRIGANGKSVCRINGKTATVSMLREIGALLVNIHGQHDSQALLDPKEQYRYIDMLLDDKKIIDEYRASFKELLHIRKRIKALAADEDAKRRELELLDYQIDELESADIKKGERDELSARKKLITQSGKISEALNNIIMLISGDDNTGG
ncbi:MAG: AAA family ATPase, partial [Clostridiales bacterium]|nr:AAA family ATPase [Clostridiales bacterium]